MHPENLDANRDLELLVAEYETKKELGEVVFLEESSFFRLISYYERENHLEQALEVLSDALTHYRFSADFYIKKAQLLIDLHRDVAALDALDEAEIYAPAEPEILLLRVELLAYTGHQEDALRLLHEIRELASEGDMADLLLTESIVYETQNDFDAMFDSLVMALEKDPTHQEALDRFWICVEVTRKYEGSIPILEKLLNDNAYSSPAWYDLGHAYAYQGDYMKAITAYEYAFLSNPHFEEAYRNCASLCLELQQFQRALSILQDVLEQFPPDADLYFDMGRCYQGLEQFQMARTFFQEALRLDPGDDEVLFELGNSFASEQKWKQASRYFKKAIELDNKRDEYYAALADACAELGILDEAETYYRLAITQAPEEIRYWLSFAMVLLEEEKVDKALELLEEAEEYAPGAELLYCRVVCLITGGKRQEALYWLGEALLEDYDMHHYLFEIIPSLREDSGVLSLISSYHGG